MELDLLDGRSGQVTGAFAGPLPEARNPYLVYLSGLRGVESARTMGGCLDRIALLTGASGQDRPGLLFPWHLLRYEHTSLIRATLLRQTGQAGEPWSPSYLNKHLSALRGVLKTAWRLTLMTAEDYHRARDVPNVTGSRLPTGRSLAASEFVSLLRTCLADPAHAGSRDAALIAVLYNTGMRRAELAAARIEQYDPGSRLIRVVGKRDKERAAPLNEPTAVYLGRWLALYGARTGPLFPALHRSGALLDRPRPMTPAAIGQLLNRRRLASGLPALTAHDFRRTFIGDLLDAGADLATVQALAGHASPVTTSRYDRRPERVRQEAVSRLRIPAPDEL